MFCNLGRNFCCAALVLCAVSAVVAADDEGAIPQIARPNAEFVPGATNPDITQANINQNICKRGWSTRSIRPPSSYTSALKKEQLRAYGDTKINRLRAIATRSGKRTRPDIGQCIERSANPACYEEDHLISLELGGHPTSRANLWAEPWFGAWNARVKDTLETRLHRMVCDGTLSLEAAQQAVATDWVAAYQRYIAHAPMPPRN